MKLVRLKIKKQGISLAEVVIALCLLGILIPPIMKAFQQSHEMTARQINQEVALKAAESAITAAQGIDFTFLSNPPDNASMPFHLELPGKISLDSNIPFSGKPAKGAVSFSFGKTTFLLSLEAEKMFPTGAGKKPVLFSYAVSESKIATFSCPDSFLLLSAKVEFLSVQSTQTMLLQGCRMD